MSIQPGKYLATAIGGAMGTDKNGKLRIGVQFKIKDSTETIWWTGGFHGSTPEKQEKAVEMTSKTLALVDYNDDVEPKEQFGPEQFRTQKEVELEIEEQEYTNDKGEAKKSMRVKWVNAPGGGMKFGAVEPGQLKTLVKSSNLKAEIAKARASLGVKKKEVKNHAPSGGSEEVPF